MKFDELDARMRVFETAHDHCVLPGIYMVARIDGRNFTRLTKEVLEFEAPFDVRFRDYMVATTEHLMQCGFRAVYGYTESDEISILLHRDESAFGRKVRKLDSILAGEASAKFSVLLGSVGAFDCRVSQLPTAQLAVDYFRWRSEDAHRNALNAHCYWTLRRAGDDAAEAANRLSRLSTADKNELLYARAGVNFNDLPLWQRRGVGLFWENKEVAGFNPKTGQPVTANRRKLTVEMNLPMKEEYSAFVERLIVSAGLNERRGKLADHE